MAKGYMLFSAQLLNPIISPQQTLVLQLLLQKTWWHPISKLFLSPKIIHLSFYQMPIPDFLFLQKWVLDLHVNSKQGPLFIAQGIRKISSLKFLEFFESQINEKMEKMSLQCMKMDIQNNGCRNCMCFLKRYNCKITSQVFCIYVLSVLSARFPCDK